MKRIAIVSVLLLAALAAFAADPAFTLDYQMNVVAADAANNYLTFSGLSGSANKDQFDAATGASKLESTVMLNAYRTDLLGGKIMPGALRSLLLYPVADDKTRIDDALSVSMASSGVITIRYVHRGTAYEIVTDKSGKLSMPSLVVKTRKIGHTDNTIHSDFSSNGKASGVDWAKVWNASIADGKQVGSTTSKTGKITDDVANSTVYEYKGDIQVSFDGKILKMAGTLLVVKK